MPEPRAGMTAEERVVRVSHGFHYDGWRREYVVEKVTTEVVFTTRDVFKAQAYIDGCAKNRHRWGDSHEADQSNTYKVCTICGATAWD